MPFDILAALTEWWVDDLQWRDWSPCLQLEDFQVIQWEFVVVGELGDGIVILGGCVGGSLCCSG